MADIEQKVSSNGNHWRITQAGQGRKKKAAVIALLSEKTLLEAAEKAKISERTLIRWKQEPKFAAAYQQAQEQVLDESLNHLRRSSLGFAKTIAELAQDTSLPGVVRLQAASRGLELLLRFHSMFDVERRLTQLESELAAVMQGVQ